MTNLFPVHQVAAVPDRNARKIFEAAVDQPKIPVHPAHARVRIKTRNYWVFVGHEIIWRSEMPSIHPAAALRYGH